MGKTVHRLSVAVIAVICTLSITLLAPGAASLPEADSVMGQIQQYKVQNNESLVEIARRFDLGFNAIVDANPNVDPFIPKAGTLITIPTAWILPNVSMRPAIVINIPEFRLYFLPEDSSGAVMTFPLGIGDEGTDTPVGTFKVIEKIANPAWYVPKSIRGEAGLPKVVPPGPDNPMGSHALRLSMATVLIHGTNRPWGIGRRSSHGCLRLYPEDIVHLFELVPKGMQVVIMNQPIKVGARGERVFVEVHQYEGEDLSVGRALHLLADSNLVGLTDFAKLIRAVEEKKGVPVDVTLLH
jgi:L,D-transpeptidase ErfK/SrfK